jgi:hypothetical protein
MLRQLLAAIKPTLRLDQIIQQWNQIRHHLSEAHRRRKLQLHLLS